MEAEQSVKRGQTGKREPPTELAEVSFYIFAVLFMSYCDSFTLKIPKHVLQHILVIFYFNTCGEEDK